MAIQVLVDGKIPAKTVCPWRNSCQVAINDRCYHHGVDQIAPYSCSVARAFEITEFPTDAVTAESR